MRRSRGLYVIGVLVGLSAVLLMVPRIRATIIATLNEMIGRARQAWEEGRREMERREHELEAEVRGEHEDSCEPPEAPDYIV